MDCNYDEINEFICNDIEYTNIILNDYKLFEKIYHLGSYMNFTLRDYIFEMSYGNSGIDTDTDEMLNRAGDFFRKVDKSYYHYFVSLMNSNRIIFNSEKSSFKNGEVYISNNNVVELIHEVMHGTNEHVRWYFPTRRFLSELVSIFFENYYFKLNEEENFNQMKKNRLFDTYLFSSSNVLSMGMLYEFKRRHGAIDENSYQLLNNELGAELKKDQFEQLLIHLTSQYKRDASFVESGSYVLSYLLNNYIFHTKDINKEYINKMKILNRMIRNENISIEEALKIIDVDINDECLFDNLLGSLQDELRELNIEKQKVKK